MSRVFRLTLAAVMAALLSGLFFQVALADSPDSSQCGADIGVHKQVGDKRFSVKGVITNIAGSNITICGIVVNTSHAKIKGDPNQAMTQKFLVTVVGKISGNTNEAQGVIVHSHSAPSGVTCKNEDQDETDNGKGNQNANPSGQENKNKSEGVGNGNDKNRGQAEAKTADDNAVAGLEKASEKVDDAVQQVSTQATSMSQPVKDSVITILQRLIDSLQKLLSSLKP